MTQNLNVLLQNSTATVIRHPLMELEFSSTSNAEKLNLFFSYRLKQLHALETREDWYRWVMMHLPQDRSFALSSVADKMDDQSLAKAVGEVWTDPNVVFHTCDVLRNVLFVQRARSDKGFAINAMTTDELSVFHNLPETFKAYRAHDWYNGDGCSWTLSREIAESIRVTLGYPTISERICNREDCVAYFGRRDEAEVIL